MQRNAFGPRDIADRDAGEEIGLAFDRGGALSRPQECVRDRAAEAVRVGHHGAAMHHAAAVLEFLAHRKLRRHARGRDRDNLDAIRGLAQNLMNDGQTDAALDQYKIIADANPEDAQTYLRMAEIYRKQGKFDQALEDGRTSRSGQKMNDSPRNEKQIKMALSLTLLPFGPQCFVCINPNAVFFARVPPVSRYQ